jgi:hypothetical protein
MMISFLATVLLIVFVDSRDLASRIRHDYVHYYTNQGLPVPGRDLPFLRPVFPVGAPPVMFPRAIAAVPMMRAPFVF